jgi:hypothetical protein
VHEANLPELIAAISKHLRIDGDATETYSMTASEILQKLRMKITMAAG